MPFGVSYYIIGHVLQRSVNIVVAVGQNALVERKMQLCPVPGCV
jgi:hypothetical protein